MRKPVLGAALAACALVPVAISAQQTVRFNDAAPLERPEEPPLVSVWVDGGSMFRFGQPVRVRYRVEEDAYVVVARVNWEGQLTLLHPRARNRQSMVRGGTDHMINGNRLGASGTFVANERNGGTGYVFAIASWAPFDLSRLSQRDFSAWVTGISMGQPVSRYVGDPHRVISRFSQLVLWDEGTTFDYDVAYYSVDSPTWMTTASSFDEPCFGNRYQRGNSYGYNYYGYGHGYDDYGYCNETPWGLQRCALGFSYHSWSMGLPMGCFGGLRRQQVARHPNPPPVTPPGRDSVRVNPWAPESIGRPNVDQRGASNGPHRMTVEPAVAPVAVGRDQSYSIPPRAWQRMRDRSEREGRASGAEASGPMPMPARPSPVATEDPSIEWVRPPRAMAPVNRDGDRGPPPRRGASRDDAGESRGSARRHDPPPRTATPVYERERRRPADDGRGRSSSAGATRRNDPPPRAVDRSPATRNPPAPAPVRSEPSRPPATERKPTETRKPTEERKP